MSPGPNGLLIAKTVPLSGKAAGYANIAGFVAAFYLHGALSILGISLVLTRSAELFFIVKILGAAYLCWLGVTALWSAWVKKESAPRAIPPQSRRTLGKAFLEGFLTNALNPKVSMFYLAAFPQFISASDPAGAAIFLVFIHSAINLIWFSAMVFLFSQLAGAARSQAFQNFLKTATGFVFIGFGVKLASIRV